MLDLYCIQKEMGRIEGLNLTMVGDLKYGRTVHSLSKVAALFNVKFQFVSPKELKMPAELLKQFSDQGIQYSEHVQVCSMIVQFLLILQFVFAVGRSVVANGRAVRDARAEGAVHRL